MHHLLVHHFSYTNKYNTSQINTAQESDTNPIYPDCFRKCFTFLFGKLFFYYSFYPLICFSYAFLFLLSFVLICSVSSHFLCLFLFAFLLLLLKLFFIDISVLYVKFQLLIKIVLIEIVKKKF